MKIAVFLFAVLYLSCGPAYVQAHSMMTCAVYKNGACQGTVRNSAQSLLSASYRWNNNQAQLCQPEAPLKSPASLQYSPGPMGSVSAGSTFTIQWKARNHAVSNQSPRTVAIYITPKLAAGQTTDFLPTQLRKICEGPFINCGNGPNVDTTGDDVSCTLDCQMPTDVETGDHTLVWRWDWTVNDGNIYATCADLAITGGSAAQEGNNVEAPVACTQNSDCKSGICEISGFCHKQSNPIGVAGGFAIFLAVLLVVVIAAALVAIYFRNRIPSSVPSKL